MSLPELQALLGSRVWQGSRAPERAALSTGFPALDRALPHGGWPLGALTEAFSSGSGEEVGALLPALSALSREERLLAWVSPPYLPYAPALLASGVRLSRVLLLHAEAERDRLWAAEQALRSGACGAVLAWLRGGDDRALRRLQLAAEEGQAFCFAFRPMSFLGSSSPATLRVDITRRAGRLAVRVLKGRGQGEPVVLRTEPVFPAVAA